MVVVEFHNIVPMDIEMPIVIIASRFKDKWVFVMHRDRSTFEIPAGHIEPGEEPESSAKRELYEETGAVDFSLQFLTAYTVSKKGKTAGGYLFFAEIHALSKLPDFEIAEIAFFNRLPDNLTYPFIQQRLFSYVLKHVKLKNSC